MVVATALVCQFLLAASALALPSKRQSLIPTGDGSWAGALLTSTPGTLQSVAATFTIPALTAPSITASMWGGLASISIDGASASANNGNACLANTVLAGIRFFGGTGIEPQYLGIKFSLNSGGRIMLTAPSVEAFVNWSNDTHPSYVTVEAGDAVTMSISATSATAGLASIENMMTGQRSVSSFAMDPARALCLQNAKWAITGVGMPNGPIALPDFGSFTFYDAHVTTNTGADVSLSGAVIGNLEYNNQYLTNTVVASNDHSVKITYQ